LLNLPQDKETFNNFITSTYKPVLTSQHGIMDYRNYKVYFTNTLQSVKQIIEEVTAAFIESGFTAVKMQLRFVLYGKDQPLKLKTMKSYRVTLKL
jgi:hypothetical protein